MTALATITPEELEEVAASVTTAAVVAAVKAKVVFNFDAAFQTKIAALCVRDSSFMQRVDGLIDPHYFENPNEAVLVNIAVRYFRKYKAAPGDLATTTHLIAVDMRDKMIPRELGPFVATHLRDKIMDADISARDLVVDEVAVFSRHQAVASAIETSIHNLDKNDFSGIENVLRKALMVGENTDHGLYSYGDMIEGRTEERLLKLSGLGPLTGISTGYAMLDKYLFHSGWGLRELSVLMGEPKAGKSAALINFAINAAAHAMRFNVLYITLELAAKIIADRSDANISNHMMFELGKNSHDIKAKVTDWKDKAGAFHIIEFPTGSMKVSDVRRILERKKAEGIKYDLVIVDYADLMTPERFTDSTTENSKSIYAGLRGIAMEENVAILTATQTNRAGAAAAVAKMGDVADDFNKIRIADAIISINKTDEEAALNEARLYFVAMRNGPHGFALRIKQDIERMKFCSEIVGVCP